MYSVYGDGICIYNDLYLNNTTYSNGTANAVSPKLTLSDNASGSLEITLPVGNAGYDKLERLSSEIVVKRYDDEIWAGRIMSEQKDFQNSRVLTCEGELSYLIDTTQPPNTYTDVDTLDFLEAILKEHNEKVGTNRQIYLGAVTLHETISSFTTDDDTTLDVINNALIENFGGHIRIRRVYDEDGVLKRYLDYLDDYPNTNSQEIRFGKNLLDFTANWDMSDLATVVLPRGEKNSSTDKYLDVSSVNDGSRYVTNEDAIKLYGWIEVVVDWSDVTDASELLSNAKTYLESEQFDEMTIEVSAVDLAYLSDSVNPINLLDEVRCVSTPHGMDKIFPVTELSIQLDEPSNSTYTLGNKVSNNTLTGTTRSENEEILTRISNQPDEKTILQKAKDNATEIMNLKTTGFVTIIGSSTYSDGIAISSTNTYDASTGKWAAGTNLWLWNMNGLAFSNDGGYNYETAITYDGSIVADFITTGTMSADLIRTGTIKSAKTDNVSWNLDKGTFTMKSGSISLGYKDDGTYKFSVTDEGKLHATYGTIGGFEIEADNIHNSGLRMDSGGFGLKHKATLMGSYGTSVWANSPSKYGMTVTLETACSFINWSYKYSEHSDTYTSIMTFAVDELIDDDNNSLRYPALNFGCDLDAVDHVAYRFWLDPKTGGCNRGANEDAVQFLTSSHGTLTLYIRNGMLTNS